MKREKKKKSSIQSREFFKEKKQLKYNLSTGEVFALAPAFFLTES